MKKRIGFVTNSSSSSFICEICGNVESGFDMTLEDAGMYECVNGHTFCQQEALDNPSREEMIAYIMKNELNAVYTRYFNGFKVEYNKKTYTEEELFMMDEDEIFSDFYAKNVYEVPEELCPICQFIEYSQKDLREFLEKKYKVSRDEVFEEVKKFNKRRKKLYDEEYITYVCKKHDLNPAEIVAGWKEEFGSYEKFTEYLRNMG